MLLLPPRLSFVPLLLSTFPSLLWCQCDFHHFVWMREDGLTLWSRSFPVSSAVFLVYRRNVAGIFQSQLDVKTCPVRSSVFSFYFFGFIFFPTLYLLSSRFQIITWCCCRGSSTRHETSGFSSWWTQSVCRSHLFLLFSLSFRPFYLFLLFFSPLSISKGGEKQGRTDCFSHKIRIEEP